MIYIFEACKLDTEHLELRRGAELIEVEPQVFSLLVFLIENRGHVVSKDDLIAGVWGERIVSDATLNTRINAVRRAVGDTGKMQAIIRTFPRRGFRFVAEVGTPGDKTQSTETEPISSAVTGLSIAVLPFSSLSGKSEHEHLADGVVEDINTALSKHRWLQVIARNTMNTFKGQSFEIPEIGRRLGVQYVLEGSVRVAGDRVRVNAQLSDAVEGTHVWAERYDKVLSDIFALQDEIASSVAGAIQPELMNAEIKRIRRQKPSSMEAWEYAVRGRWHVLRVTEKDNSRALALLREGLEKYPDNATLTAFLSFGLNSAVLFGWSSDPFYYIRQGNELAVKAVALDDVDAWAHCALGFACFISKRPEDAIAHYRKAIDLDPSFALAHGYLALQLAFAGYPEDAIAAAYKAIRLSPHDPELFHFQVAIATAHFVACRYGEAVEWAEKSHIERPGAPGPLRLLAVALSLLGRKQEARSTFAKVIAISPHISESGIRGAIHFARPEDLERYIEGLRIAGLPH